MADRIDIDDEALTLLDRCFLGKTDGVTWPLAIVDALEPSVSMDAWARADTRDARCLWWMLCRFGTRRMLEAADSLGDADRSAVVTWLREQAGLAWIEDQPITRTAHVSYRVDASGARIWEISGG